MHSFELRPNSSLTPRAAAWFYGSLVAVLLCVAIGCTALGFWPVLPFAGLEAAVLLGAVRWVQRRATAREYIRVDDASVVIEKCRPGRRGDDGRMAYAFQRPWTRIELRRGRPAHWPSRLLLSSRGRSVEIGAFLTDGERQGLKDRLAELLANDDLSTGRN
ncbi:MAG: DUF2244 domain-containing protein [Chromatiales bacterium]|nr:DUF2244 domain-containing protein [Chromatiales bacterium]